MEVEETAQRAPQLRLQENNKEHIMKAVVYNIILDGFSLHQHIFVCSHI